MYYYIEYSVLTKQLPQHHTCRTKQHFPYTIVSTPQERKQLHRSEYNWHESETVPICLWIQFTWKRNGSRL